MNSRKFSAAIPVIDIASFFNGTDSDKQSVANAMQEACESLGFLVIAGHGVHEEVIDALYLQAKNFFDLPLDEKILYANQLVLLTRDTEPWELRP